MLQLGRSIDCHVARTMHFPAISPLLRPPCVHWPCTVATHSSQNGSSRARSQSDDGVAEMMPCQEPSDVEELLLHYAPILFCLCACCYMLRATCQRAATRRSRTLTTSHALPRARGHPRRSLGDPAGQGSLCRAACVQRAAWETRQSGCGLGATDAWGDAHLSTAVVWISSMSLPFIHTACLPK